MLVLRVLPFAVIAMVTSLASGVIHTQAAPGTKTPLVPGSQEPAPQAVSQPQPARVAYANGMLSVSAANSSLNQILLQITHATGMKLTGSAHEERVFGKFGPADLAQVLADLVTGTGTNLLIIRTSSGKARELILTPQNGPATPANATAAMRTFDQRDLSSLDTTRASTSGTQRVLASTTEGSASSTRVQQPAQPAPLTPEERAVLIERLQRQQREGVAAGAQPH